VTRRTTGLSLSIVLVAAATVIGFGSAFSANASPFVSFYKFECGSAGTFVSEVNPVPAPLPAPFAPPPEASVRLLTATSGEVDAVIVLLQVSSASTGQIFFTNQGLQANQANPNLVTCTLTRTNGEQFQVIGLLSRRG
jgi:hypothetical protein